MFETEDMVKLNTLARFFAGHLNNFTVILSDRLISAECLHCRETLKVVPPFAGYSYVDLDVITGHVMRLFESHLLDRHRDKWVIAPSLETVRAGVPSD